MHLDPALHLRDELVHYLSDKDQRKTGFGVIKYCIGCSDNNSAVRNQDSSEDIYFCRRKLVTIRPVTWKHNFAVDGKCYFYSTSPPREQKLYSHESTLRVD